MTTTDFRRTDKVGLDEGLARKLIRLTTIQRGMSTTTS